ncbi:hypothetical protein WICMUC_001175 [Wickerhamomyces mucosus]|uniref:DNA replication ATP-dependent helicase/nuclease n=1 Tax=Wickerhamomyces mucosus TaxID=1378264 RepID=A0A9P8PXM4_9ASCO|nr:hypothetical protein WICMUC_001175 [Wickerhamomyces mucosus]
MVDERKRESQLVVSPKKNNTDKRVKNEKENEEPTIGTNTRRKHHQPKFSFAPTNNLKPSQVQPDPLRSIKVDVNVPKDLTVKEPISQPSSSTKRQAVPSHLSSDDHVFWAPTPNHKKIYDVSKDHDLKGDKYEYTESTPKLPSSPFREQLKVKLNPLEDFRDKYKSINYENFATQKSPVLSRIVAKSESFPAPTSESKNSQRNKPFAKSFANFSTPSIDLNDKRKDIATLIKSVESGFVPEEKFNSLLNTGHENLRFYNETPIKQASVLKKKFPMKIEHEDTSDIFSDDFSEDFLSDLNTILERKPRSQDTCENETKTKTMLEDKELNNVSLKLGHSQIDPALPAIVSENITLPHVDIKQKDYRFEKKERFDEQEREKEVINDDNDAADGDDGDDDDDDDDEFLSIIEKKMTQTQRASNACTTQEKIMERADREGSVVFKKEIDDSQGDLLEYKAEQTNGAVCAVPRPGVKRFQVMKIIKTHFVIQAAPSSDFPLRKPQKVLIVRDKDDESHKIVLRDIWETLEIEVKDIIHIIGEDYKLLHKNSNNLLIWNPDQLLSATLIGDAISCLRRSVLKQRLDFSGDYSVPLLVGEIIHEVFQAVLRENNSSMEFMNKMVDQALAFRHMNILIIQESMENVKRESVAHLPYIKEWYEKFKKENPASKVKLSNEDSSKFFAASNILDIEEDILSHVYGIRGFIDVTIEAFVSDLKGSGKYVTPLELKTGAKESYAHTAQGSLYTLMMKDRYEMDVNFFMLVYTKNKKTVQQILKQDEIRHLIVLRNQLSRFLKENTRELPPLVKQSQCERCYVNTECMTYYKLMESGIKEESGINEVKFTELTAELDVPKYKEFFNHWDDLITKEESILKIASRDLFLVDSLTREKTTNRCIGNLVIDQFTETDGNEEQEKFIYTFKRKDSELGDFNGSQIFKFDRVLISDENGHFKLAVGWVMRISPKEIVISSDKRLRNINLRLKNFNMKNNQIVQSHLKPIDPTLQESDKQEDVLYRIDRDDMFHGMKLARSNVLNLFLHDGDVKRRSLIVDGKAPAYHSNPLPYSLPGDHTFNVDQISAFNKILSAKDYSLLLGMPGTGKTTVIAHLIKDLVSHGKTVLLTSYTHSAVDNILIKIKNSDIDVLRLGSLRRIHPEVRHFSPLNKEIKTGKDLENVYYKPFVVATTCLGINEWIFNKRTFDYCIVDESSQVSMPVCLGPLKFCDKFILVGDHYQLPPLVQNPKAKGLSRSLFKILSEAYPSSVVSLTHQYRMCKDIMLLSNTIIYEGRLKCGSEMVANQSLNVPGLSNLISTFDPELSNHQRWLDWVLDEKRKVLFLNHDNVGGCQEIRLKENIENPKEAEIIQQIVQAMTLCGVPEHSIGIMSFYRAQLRRFIRVLAVNPAIEKLTADQFQGRDKDCVIISLVRSNDRNDAGSLIKEWRRLNVAITRAKSKLIIVGSKKTLQNLKTIDAFMNILDSRGWFYDLPPHADKLYHFKTQTQLPRSTNLTEEQSQIRSQADKKVFQNRQLAKEIIEEAGL